MQIGIDQYNRPAPKWVAVSSFLSVVALPFIIAILQGTPAEVMSQLWTNYLTLIFSALAGALKALETFSGNGTIPPTNPGE